MRAVIGLDKLCGDPQTIARLSDRSFDDVRRMKLCPDLFDIDILAFELECRGARDHAQIRHLGESRGNLLRHSVGKKIPDPCPATDSGMAVPRLKLRLSATPMHCVLR